jgi:hypothetical protein
MNDTAFVLLLFTLASGLRENQRRREKLPPFTPDPGEDNLGVHPLPPNPLQR